MSPIVFFDSHLQVRKHINDLYEDLRDGHNLISLLEVLSGDTLVSSGLLCGSFCGIKSPQVTVSYKTVVM